MNNFPAVIIGAGPAGLTAGYELAARNAQPILLLEKADKVGGVARTETYRDYYFDIGGHRFFTKVEPLQQLWQELLGDRFITVDRLSRIYYEDRFFNYPISLPNTLVNMGISESILVLLSFLKAQIKPSRQEETFETWVTNRFGHRLYEKFFKTYTEKVWGIPCNEIRSDWAAQRIRGLSLTTAVANSLFGSNHVKSLIGQFHYPTLGPGLMWQQMEQVINQRGGHIRFGAEVVKLARDGHRIQSVEIQTRAGHSTCSADDFISSMPISDLVKRLHPPPPVEILNAARGLKYRAFIIVCLIVDETFLFEDNWIYIHAPRVKVGRIQNYKNWSKAMVPDQSTTSLGMEYFCSEGDEIWSSPDADLIALATEELAQLKLATKNQILDGVVFRQPKAYPVYDGAYRKQLEEIRHYLAGIDNLQTIGRNGMHRYNNMDHSMLTGLLAAKNLLGEHHDLWSINARQEYAEV